jgi:hypothetical protein
VYKKPRYDFNESHMVRGLCLLPTGRRGEYIRIGRMDFGNDESKHFEDGLRVQRLGEEVAGMKAHPPMLDDGLYEVGKAGVFSII